MNPSMVAIALGSSLNAIAFTPGVSAILAAVQSLSESNSEEALSELVGEPPGTAHHSLVSLLDPLSSPMLLELGQPLVGVVHAIVDREL